MAKSRERLISSFDGEKIWYETFGQSKDPMVLCDGIGCSGFIWKHFKREFQNRHKILHFNYRGHGRSPLPSSHEHLGVEGCAEDLYAVLKNSRLRQKVVLVGHSMGVQVALEFYKRYPDRVKAIIAINGTYGNLLDNVHDTDLLAKALPYLNLATSRWPFLAKLGWEKLMKSPFAMAWARAFEVNPTLMRREDFKPYFEDLAAVEPSLFFKTLRAASLHSAEKDLKKIAVPTLIVASEKDTFTPQKLAKKMHKKIPRSQLLWIPGGSHIGPLEIPELLHLRVAHFLESI